MCDFSDCHFERNCDTLKQKSPCFLLNKNTNLNKNHTKLKIENPSHTSAQISIAN